VSLEVTRALAASLGAGLDGQHQGLHDLVGRIFEIPMRAAATAAETVTSSD
jgi:hypothetical protein